MTTKNNAKGRAVRKVSGYSPHEIVTAEDKRAAKRAAEELEYDKIFQDIGERIMACETVAEITNLLRQCRLAS